MAKKNAEHVDDIEVMADSITEEPKTEDELVTIFVPLIPGESPEVTVCINGHYTKFKRGETVQVKKNVAEVLENANQMAKVAAANRERLKRQVREL